MTALRSLLRRWFPYLEDSALFFLGMLVPIGATVLLCIALASPAKAAEIPEGILAGIAQVETGSIYRNGELVHYRDKRDGADGEVGPWQLSPDVLKDMGVSHLRSRIRREVVLAESMTRAWLIRCYRKTGNWADAVAVYHVGPGGSARRGRDYAQRVMAIAESN